MPARTYSATLSAKSCWTLPADLEFLDRRQLLADGLGNDLGLSEARPDRAYRRGGCVRTRTRYPNLFSTPNRLTIVFSLKWGGLERPARASMLPLTPDLLGNFKGPIPVRCASPTMEKPVVENLGVDLGDRRRPHTISFGLDHGAQAADVEASDRRRWGRTG